MGKGQSFQQMALGKLDVHKHKNEISPYLLPYTKINSKYMHDINVRPKSIKLLEEKVGENLCDLEFRQGFIKGDTRAQTIKEKSDTKELRKIKRQDIKHISDEGVVSNIHKELV